VQGWGRTGLIAVVVLVVALVSLLLVRPARAQGDVHVFTGPPGTHKFFDFGRPGLRLGDRLVARGALLDETQETEVGSFSMDCFVVRAISDEPAGPGRVAVQLPVPLAEGDLILEGLDPLGPVSTPSQLSEVLRRSRARGATRRSSTAQREPSS